MTDSTPPEPPAPAAYVPPAGALAPPPPPVPPAPPAYVPPVPMPYQTDTSRNWMGILSLIFGIIGGWLLALVFGILGLSGVKQGKATNKGMNIAGIVLGAVWFVVSIVLVLVFVSLAANSTILKSMRNAAVGDCYTSTVQSTEGLVDVNPVFGSCAAGTNAEVYYVGEFDGTSSPDDDAFMDELWTFCTSDAAIARVDADVAYDYFVEYYIPYADTWSIAPHTIVCGLSSSTGTIDPGAVLND